MACEPPRKPGRPMQPGGGLSASARAIKSRAARGVRVVPLDRDTIEQLDALAHRIGTTNRPATIRALIIAWGNS